MIGFENFSLSSWVDNGLTRHITQQKAIVSNKQNRANSLFIAAASIFYLSTIQFNESQSGIFNLSNGILNTPDYSIIERMGSKDKFNFDLDSLQNGLASPAHEMPKDVGFKEFVEWMNQIAKLS